MLQIPQPGSEGVERRAGWHHLTEIFSASLHEAFVSDGPLDFISLHQTLDTWESFARAHDGNGPLGHPNTLDEWERMRAMLWCAEHVQKTAALPGGAPSAALTELPPAAPREALSRADWSLACIRLFRGEAPGRRIAVPIALADEMVQLKGGIATLVLDVFSPGAGRLTLHPEESFRVLPDADFTESLNTSWQLALEIAKRGAEQTSFPDVVWWVMKETPSISGLEEQGFFESTGLRWKGPIGGRSASGAAARAFRLLLKGTNIEPDVFVLAQVRRNVTSTIANPLLAVGGITAKVEAIADTDRHVVIVVTEEDKVEAEFAVSKKKAGSRIDIRLSVPPAIEKLLDDAKKLSDADRFADAIPVLEKALDAASHARHRAAEAKIRIRLGHALFEGREDSAAAENHFRKALELAGKTPTEMRHNALHGLGDMLLWAGRLDEARAIIHTSLEVAKTVGKEDLVACSLISQALLDRHLGRAEFARSHLDEAIRIFNQLSLTLTGEAREENAHELAVCYHNKAQLECDDGRSEEALALYAKVEELHRDSGDKLNAGKIHLLTGRLHCANGNADQGFQYIKQALGVFLDLGNHLWMARSAAAMARLYAQHAQADGSPNTEMWKEAARAAFAAKDGFEEAKALSEQVESTLFAADILAHLVKADLRSIVQKQIHDIFKRVPKAHDARAAGDINAEMDRIHAEVDEKVRTDEGVGRLLQEAHELAERDSLHEERAECFVAECRMRIAEDETETRKKLLEKALACLQIAVPKENIPKRKAHLMGKIGALHRELGRKPEWANCVKRVGEVFEKTGDIRGLANYHLELAGVHRSQGRLEEQISSDRKALELIEGRSFHDLAAAARINLADGLRLKDERVEALSLLAEAEAICEVHKMRGMIGRIARIRSAIEEDTEAGQAGRHSLPQLLGSLHQLVRFKPEDATSYLAFWYYAWKTELMTILRSGPRVSLMAVTDDAERFMSFAAQFANLADHFAMATTTEPTVVASARILHIPPRWLYPATFTFVGVRKTADTANESEETTSEAKDDVPPRYHLVGPARMLPRYMHVSVGGDGSRVSVMGTPVLPAGALHLMLQQPVKELIRRRAIWFPTSRFDSEDAFLSDLRVAHDRGLFPVYFDRLPSSAAVTEIGAISVRVPASALAPAGRHQADKWKRALLRLPLMQKDAAKTYLTELPDVFSTSAGTEGSSIFEVHLFEFAELGRRVIRPVLLVR